MIRTSLARALAAALIAAALPAAADTPQLRAHVVVDGAVVTLGDLLDNAGAAASLAVFRAPEPGMTGTVAARRVVAAAAEHGLDAVATHGVDRVSVSRTSREIASDEVVRRIAERLVAEGLADAASELDIRLAEGTGILHVEADSNAPLSVSRIDYDRRSGRFTAALTVADSRVLGPGIRVGGRAVAVVEVPVLARAVGRGETLSRSDIVVRRMPRTEIRDEALLDTGRIAGMAARRALRAGTPIEGAWLAEPVLVERNQAVTISYRAPGLTLNVRGRAVMAGARGDIVTVINNQSRRTLEAVVSGPGQVMVQPAPQAMAHVAGVVR